MPLTVKLLCTAPVDKILPAVLITPDTFIVPPVYAAALMLPEILKNPVDVIPPLTVRLLSIAPAPKMLPVTFKKPVTVSFPLTLIELNTPAVANTLPAVLINPLTVNDVSVPRLVIKGCAAVPIVPAVVFAPVVY